MLRVAIVEDNAEDQTLLENLLNRYASENKEQFQISFYARPYDFLEHYSDGFDLVFMDIEMPGMNGMETAADLRNLDADVPLIFVTNMAQYALNGYNVGALDYILKPLSYYPFAMKLKKALRHVQRFCDTMLTLKIGDGLVRVAVSKIRYIEVHGHQMTWHTEEGAYVTRATMNTVEKQLAPYHFMRCNNCYLINPRHVTSVQDYTVVIGDTPLQISRARRAGFMRELTNFLA